MATGDLTLGDLYGHRTAIAEWSSILAIFVSLYAAVTITRVRSQILGRVRLPALVSAIEKNAKLFVGLMREYEANKERFGLELAKCETNLRLVRVSIKGRPKSTIRALLKSIKKYNGHSAFWSSAPADSRNDAWEIYKSLNALIEELKHALEDQRVGG